MKELAEQYAKAKGTHVLDSKIYNDEIVFVLATGQKLRYTQAQLKKEIQKLSPATADEPKAKEPKAKAKE